VIKTEILEILEIYGILFRTPKGRDEIVSAISELQKNKNVIFYSPVLRVKPTD